MLFTVSPNRPANNTNRFNGTSHISTLGIVLIIATLPLLLLFPIGKRVTL